MSKFKDRVEKGEPLPVEPDRCMKCGTSEYLHRCGPRHRYDYLCTKCIPRSSGVKAQIKFEKALRLVNTKVDDYLSLKPNSSKRESCMAYAEEIGLKVPSQLRETEEQRENRLEREAIQAEASSA